MDLVWIVVSLVALTAWVTWLVVLVRRDGLGHREPPRSHHAWDEVPPPPPSTHVPAR